MILAFVVVGYKLEIKQVSNTNLSHEIVHFIFCCLEGEGVGRRWRQERNVRERDIKERDVVGTKCRRERDFRVENTGRKIQEQNVVFPTLVSMTISYK